MRRLNVKFRVVLGLVSIAISIAMLAFYLGVIPDKAGVVRKGRASLAEAIAVHSTAFVMEDDFQRLEADLNLMAERNDDLLSLALRRSDGWSLVSTGDHDDRWQSMGGEYSKNTQVRVPIWAGEQKWGQLELRFKALNAGGLRGVFDNPMIRLVVFIGLLCFVAFYFYIGKVLRHLDPSKAIPGRVRSALDTLAGGLLVLDHKEQIVLANKSFAALLEKRPEDLLGYRAGDLPWIDTQDNPLDKSERPWVQALDRGEAQTKRILRLRLPGIEGFTFSINCSPVLGAGGKYAGVLVSFDDVTQLEKKEIELRISKEEAETANQAKSAFLANMSHEIRTPMTAILGFTEILKRGYGRNMKDSLRYLDTIHSSGKNLLELINDILDLSKVESGRLEMEAAWIEPHRVIHEVLQMLGIKAQEKGISLGFKVQSAIPQQIKTDPARLRQIIFNLVGNAIKFTEQGDVTVFCRFGKFSTGPRLLIDIADTGIGIPPEKVESIFDPFTQADTEITRRFGGTGLGLSISREFARALGGDILVESWPGKGSTFKVTLTTGDLKEVPFLEPEEIETATRVSAESKPSHWQFPEARILVVDDGAENRELLRLILEEAGLTVHEAENGSVGVTKAVDGHYDAILMDVNMPVMDGFTATGRLRQHGLKTPIIALTANAMKGFEQECLDAGYSGYFSKPIDMDRFMARMADLLGGKPVANQPPEEADGSAAILPDETPQPMDDSPIVSKLPSNNERFRNLIARFIVRLNEQLETVERLCIQGKHQEIAVFAHWLKGSGGTVGFDEFTAPASRLETLVKKSDNAAEIRKIIAELRGLTARVVVPENAQSEPSASAIAPSENTITDFPSKAFQAVSKIEKPLTSRLEANPRFHGIICQFVEKLKSEIGRAELVLKEGNFSEIALIAHWMKGSGGTVGFDDFTAPATKLEALAKTAQVEQVGQILQQLKIMSEAIVPPNPVQAATTIKRSM